MARWTRTVSGVLRHQPWTMVRVHIANGLDCPQCLFRHRRYTHPPSHWQITTSRPTMTLMRNRAMTSQLRHCFPRSASFAVPVRASWARAVDSSSYSKRCTSDIRRRERQTGIRARGQSSGRPNPYVIFGCHRHINSLHTYSLQWVIPAMAPLPPHPLSAFPPPDLLARLIELYFLRYNLFMPLLHRPTFESQVEAGLHLTDEAFGSTVLLVCAIGSRFSDDLRVLLDEEIMMNGARNEPIKWQSAGWRWFREVQTTRKVMLLSRTRLFDLQICCVSLLLDY